jgi:hypothetical protein
MSVRLLLLVAVFAAGCGASRSSRRLKPEIQAPPEAWQGVARIAVLPPDNWTTEVGAEHVAWHRAVIAQLVRERGYAVTPLVEVNRFMLRNRFTLAGEVRLYSTAELCAEFRSDAVLFWDITGGAGHLNMDLVKADGTRLWGTGEVHLDLPYDTLPQVAASGSDQRWALAFGEVLRRLPAKP